SVIVWASAEYSIGASEAAFAWKLDSGVLPASIREKSGPASGIPPLRQRDSRKARLQTACGASELSLSPDSVINQWPRPLKVESGAVRSRIYRQRRATNPCGSLEVAGV